MSKKLSNLLLALVIFVGGLIRLSNLVNFPTGFTPDEAAFGYNAYSILLTGKDEWGVPAWQLFSQNLRSFGDYKLPLYSFLAVPTVKFLGLNEEATRLPNAIFGTLAIFSIYLLANKLFPNSRIGLLTAALVAVSPWHVSLSRGAFESNLVTFFLPLAIYLYLRKKYLLSVLFFVINLYSYHSARLITPFVFLVLLIFFRPKFTKKLAISLLVFILLTLPAIFSYLGAGQGRLSDVSLLNPTDNWSGVADRRFQDGQAGLTDKYSRIFNNKLTALSGDSVRNYLSYLSPQFLFTQGAGEATYGMIPGRGLFYFVELPFLLFALIKLIKKPSRSALGLLSFVLISPIPATLAKSLGFSANRAAPMFPFLIILIAFGLSQLKILQAKMLKIVTPLIIFVYILHISFFIEDYVFHAPRLNAPSMSYGWSEAISRFKPISSQYSQIKVSRSFSESQIFIAFYWPVPPSEYQKSSVTWSDFNQKGFRFLDQLDGYYLGNFRFGDLNPNDPVTVPTLLIGKPDEFSEKSSYYFQIFAPTGKPVIQISSKQP
jgi:4-amino-4-deoxy-L-arabinose transferase-like glycosyltransferase